MTIRRGAGGARRPTARLMSALGYFRATLADGARPRVDFSRAHEIAWEQARAGRLDETFAARVVRDAARRRETHRKSARA